MGTGELCNALASHPVGSRNTRCCLMPQELGYEPLLADADFTLLMIVCGYTTAKLSTV